MKRPKVRWHCSSARCLKHQEPSFKVEGYHVSIRRDRSVSVCQASVKVKVDGVTEHTHCRRRRSGERAGRRVAPRARRNSFLSSKRCGSTDYKVRILDSTAGTGARTRVLIESTDGKEEWGTVGVHDNIIEASLQASATDLSIG